MSFFGKSEQKSEVCSETHLHKLLAKREELQQSLTKSRKQLTKVLQSDVVFNGEAKAFGEFSLSS
jgi:hypothetical protein